ncbi:MAG: hypothetical protein ASARMPREDX12_000982 [Alectoria sarmentosa]|nr:MAG: hypothetical protein ASARMPREDX12_000982 [Alectoria sarmentosa]
MSQNPTNTRPDEEALVVLLIIAALGFGSMFAVAKTVGKRFIGPALEENGRGSGNDCEPKESKKRPRIGTDRDGTNTFHNTRSKMEDHSLTSRTYTPQEPNTHNNNRTSQSLQASPLLSIQRTHDREQGLSAIRAWEEATSSRIRREKTRKLERFLSLDQRDINRTQGLEAVRAWEQSTMSRFRQEMARRLERLDSLDQEKINREESREVVGAWEQASARERAWRNGVKAVRDWER